ncbi:uncharacterized protein PAC_14674 [Phialocephala subalpina]|uniref:Uncharacterized protein n=1 Tax=Phialocephala subalpina TaxID=576137 RepID=A0A1L7XIA9_9HELO|nr:uncharacterized protein PAC_14674 [Phialocephala subalpina]
MSEHQHCYLVYRRNYGYFKEDKDYDGLEEVLACYANLQDVNRHAKTEINRFYRELYEYILESSPIDDSEREQYAAHVVLDDRHKELHRVEVRVARIEIRPSYDGDEDAMLEEKEDALVKSEPGSPLSAGNGQAGLVEPSPEPRPFPLPDARPGCLNGFRIVPVGNQYPYDSSEMETLIKEYGGEFEEYGPNTDAYLQNWDDWEKVQQAADQRPYIFYIFTAPYYTEHVSHPSWGDIKHPCKMRQLHFFNLMEGLSYEKSRESLITQMEDRMSRWKENRRVSIVGPSKDRSKRRRFHSPPQLDLRSEIQRQDPHMRTKLSDHGFRMSF